MDIASRLKQLEDLVAEAKSMPLSASVLVNREEMLGVLASVREGLPEEIKQARWVVKDREELLGKARKDAEDIVQRALDEQQRLAGTEEVVRRAEQEADRLLGEARAQARQIRLEAEDYVDAQLAAFEGAIQKITESLSRSGEEVAATRDRLAKIGAQIGAGRQRLRGGSPEGALTAEHEPEEAG